MNQPSVDAAAKIIHQNYAETQWSEADFESRNWARGTARSVLNACRWGSLLERGGEPTSAQVNAAYLAWNGARLEGQYVGITAMKMALQAAGVAGEEPNPALLLPDPKGGCDCEWHSQDAGGGHTEYLLEYSPSCPEHSRHVYNPRTGIWDLADEPRWRPAVLIKEAGKWEASLWRPDEIEEARTKFPDMEFALGQVAIKSGHGF